MPLMKSASPISPDSPNAPNPGMLKAYLLASRPKTWIAGISPVLIGASMADQIRYEIFFLTLLFSLLIQIGTNYANDYFDFVKGADSPLRNGPKRATQQGWISPSSMRWATFFIFASALLIGMPLILATGLWSFFLALACIAFGILYTGGPKPLGYLGLGEGLVFLFFGPIATCGTYFLQTQSLTWPVFISSFAPGLLSCSILVANNLRDEKSDRAVHKKTLIARFGRTFGSWEYAFTIIGAALVPPILVFVYQAPSSLLMASAILPLAFPWIKKAFVFRDPLELISVLQGSAFLLFLYTLFFTLFS